MNGVMYAFEVLSHFSENLVPLTAGESMLQTFKPQMNDIMVV